jgi:nucleotide-binding universal stress UspA family protein
MRIKENFTVLAKAASERVKSNASVLKTIVVPIDFSESSVRALRHAAAMAERDHARLTLLNVVDEPQSFRTLDAPERQRRQEHDRRVQLQDLAQRELPPSQTVHIEVREGNPPREIVRLASRQNADLIVLGLGQWRGLRRWFHGRIAASIVRDACCPVLMLKGGAA